MVTLEQVKEYLGITSNTNNIRLQFILDSNLGILTTMIGDYSYGEKTIKVKNTCLKDKIGLMHINIDESEDFSIDGNIITDYMLLDNGEVEVKNIYQYITSDFSVSKVQYTAGYETTPSDIIGAVSEKVGFDFAKEMGQVVASEQMGPRSVEFFGDNKSSSQAHNDFIKNLRFYIPLHLRIW